MPKEFVLQAVVVISIFAILDVVGYWVTGTAQVSFRFYSIMMLTFGAAFRWGAYAGAGTLALLTLMTWWFWGEGFDWGTTLIAGTGLTLFGSIWKTIWQGLCEKRGGGEGRLAWQSSEVGSQTMLWHNGMVGGSASFLGIVEEYEIGVVVLTNTAKSVDAIGVKILSELVDLKTSSSVAEIQSGR